MRTFLMASVVVGLMVMGQAIADEKDDIRLAEQMITEMKLVEIAEKAAYLRAFKAITGTSEGKNRLSRCSRKDPSYWPTCIRGKWDYESVWALLYKKFYEEELAKLKVDDKGS